MSGAVVPLSRISIVIDAEQEAIHEAAAELVHVAFERITAAADRLDAELAPIVEHTVLRRDYRVRLTLKPGARERLRELDLFHVELVGT